MLSRGPHIKETTTDLLQKVNTCFLRRPMRPQLSHADVPCCAERPPVGCTKVRHRWMVRFASVLMQGVTLFLQVLLVKETCTASVEFCRFPLRTQQRSP